MPDLFGSYGLAERLQEPLASSRAVKVLEDSLQQQRLAHAILLHGEDIGALGDLAEAVAATLLDTDDATLHPDFHTVRPAKKMRQISVEPMRELIRNISHSSNRGGNKVTIVYEADRMNKAAANAFLKTLEEPPAGTTLLLITARPYDLLDTIRSRCFNFRVTLPFRPLRHETWEQWLDDYRTWLDNIENQSRNRGATADLLMNLYGLIARFSAVLTELGDTAWKEAKETLPENLEDAESAAQEAGVRKGLRARLFADIEQATREHAFAPVAAGQPPSAPSLARSVAQLERSYVLNDVFNLKEDAALEYFLLNSLRLWSGR